MTTGFPCEWQTSINRSVSACCDNIPPVKTRSAHAISSLVTVSVLQSMRRVVQLAGNIAATVISPSGAAGRRYAHKAADFSKAPERVRDEERIKHEYVAGSRRVHSYSQTGFDQRHCLCQGTASLIILCHETVSPDHPEPRTQSFASSVGKMSLHRGYLGPLP